MKAIEFKKIVEYTIVDDLHDFSQHRGCGCNYAYYWCDGRFFNKLKYMLFQDDFYDICQIPSQTVLG